MGLTKLKNFLRRHPRIALDTCVFIYQLESNPRYLALTDHIFTWLEHPEHSGVTSTVTMSELLVHAYRDEDQQLADEFYALLTTYPNLEWVPPSLEIADITARLRAARRIRTPDALQIATAIQCGATGLITNDFSFTRVEGVETLVLDQLL